MFEFKVTLAVPSACEAKVDRLFEALLAEQLSKRAESDFLISFNESELKIEISDAELMEKLASKILGCGTVKKFFIENQAEPKNKPEKEIEAKIKATENEHVASSETEAETESENKKEETESDSEDDTDANAEAEAKPEPEPETEEQKVEAEAEPEPKSEELANEKIREELSEEYIKKMYEESENIGDFSKKLADYTQIPDNKSRRAFIELIKAVNQTNKMSWFCIENIINKNAKLLNKDTAYNNNTKLLVSQKIKERFGLTLMKFLKTVKELMGESKVEAEVEPEPEPEPEEPKAETEVESEPKSDEVFDEYWSGIFKCMPKINVTDTERIQKVSKKEKQFLEIDKNQPLSARIKETLEIMEEINLINDETFLSLAEEFVRAQRVIIEKSTPLYQKMRLLQWSKSLQKFVQRYYTNDPNFRVRIEDFLAELREIIL